jgi:hypothetical protein
LLPTEGVEGVSDAHEARRCKCTARIPDRDTSASRAVVFRIGLERRERRVRWKLTS